MVDTYIFVPLYNVEIEDEILDKEIYGFKIVETGIYYQKYRSLLNNQGMNYATYELDQILNYNNIMHFFSKPVCNYIIIKKILCPKIIDQSTADYRDSLVGKNLNKLDCFIRASRCLYQGNIQVNQYFILSRVAKEIHTLPVSSENKCILGNYRSVNGNYFLPKYKLNAKIIAEIINFTKKLNKCRKHMSIPVAFFTDYYSTSGIIERMIKIAIVWETSVLNDCSSELKYRLQARTSALLNRDLSQVLSLAYDIRSSLVHSGKITPSELKNMKKIIKISPEETDDMACLFVFLRDHLEEITRKILQTLVNRICKTRKTLEYTAKEIDNNIFRVLEEKEGEKDGYVNF